MTSLSIAGLPVMEARINIPRAGPWTAELAVDAANALQVPQGSRQALEISSPIAGSMEFEGTVFRGGTYAQNVTLRMVGGAHAMSEKCKAHFYQDAPLQQVAIDILADVGESLSPTSTPSVLSAQFPFWATIAQPAGMALSLLAGAVGATWRVLIDGTTFIGIDQFQKSALTSFQLVDFRPMDGWQAIAAELPDVFPGESFNGFKVSSVEHAVNSRGSRAKIWFET